MHKQQISIDVPDPGNYPPPPGEAYLQANGYAAYKRQREQWERHNLCQCEQPKGLHAIGCPQAKS